MEDRLSVLWPESFCLRRRRSEERHLDSSLNNLNRKQVGDIGWMFTLKLGVQALAAVQTLRGQHSHTEG